jgi:hypothetical protein
VPIVIGISPRQNNEKKYTSRFLFFGSEVVPIVIGISPRQKNEKKNASRFFLFVKLKGLLEIIFQL